MKDSSPRCTPGGEATASGKNGTTMHDDGITDTQAPGSEPKLPLLFAETTTLHALAKRF